MGSTWRFVGLRATGGAIWRVEEERNPRDPGAQSERGQGTYLEECGAMSLGAAAGEHRGSVCMRPPYSYLPSLSVIRCLL